MAYSLAGDDAALQRLEQRFSGFYETARNPDALKVALTGVPVGRLSVADFGRVTADNEAFAGWVDKMKVKFRQKPAPVGPPTRNAAAPVAPAKQAALKTPASRG